MGNLTNPILNYDSLNSLDEWENLKSEKIGKKTSKKIKKYSTKSQKSNSGASLPTHRDLDLFLVLYGLHKVAFEI